MTNAPRTMPATHTGKPPTKPRIDTLTPEIIQPTSTPCTRRLKPPQALMAMPPINPPTAPAVCTEKGHGNAGEKVAYEKGQLQTKQAGACKNILEAVGGFLPYTALTLLSFQCAFGLGNVNDG